MGIYLIATFIVFGLIGNFVFGVPNVYMIVIMGMAALILTAYSGQVGVFWTDLIQFIFFTIILLITGLIFVANLKTGNLFTAPELVQQGFCTFTKD